MSLTPENISRIQSQNLSLVSAEPRATVTPTRLDTTSAQSMSSAAKAWMQHNTPSWVGSAGTFAKNLGLLCFSPIGKTISKAIDLGGDFEAHRANKLYSAAMGDSTKIEARQVALNAQASAVTRSNTLHAAAQVAAKPFDDALEYFRSMV